MMKLLAELVMSLPVEFMSSFGSRVLLNSQDSRGCAGSILAFTRVWRATITV